MALAMVGCGYALLRPAQPFGCREIVLYPFAERGPLAVSGLLHEALWPRLRARGIALCEDGARADAVLSGQLALKTLPAATLSSVQLYNADATAIAELHAADGQLLWRDEMTLREPFLPPDPGTFPQPMTIETRRRLAVGRLADRLAEAVASALQAAAAPPPLEQ